MKKAALVLTVFFSILTFAGAGYVLYRGGFVSPGYAVVPMVFTIVSLTLYRNCK